MNYAATSDTFPVTPYNAKALMPVSWLHEEWSKNRVLAWEVLNDDLGGLSRLERAAAPFASLFLLLNLLLLTFNIQGSLSSGDNLGETLSAPLVIPMVVVTIVCISLMKKFTKVAQQLRDKADSTISLTVASWIQRRYNTSVDVSENLALIMESKTPIRPMLGFYLDVTSDNGETSLVMKDASNGRELPSV